MRALIWLMPVLTVLLGGCISLPTFFIVCEVRDEHNCVTRAVEGAINHNFRDFGEPPDYPSWPREIDDR